ncbi:hypothetical protein GYMLUDRAFT_542241 [Collybiopsis luxurians FD-317 M1]|nr:hypothetical protein GYMLUDRAFT_542241 [Collybiopsis luxurians FD-317 M1]
MILRTSSSKHTADANFRAFKICCPSIVDADISLGHILNEIASYLINSSFKIEYSIFLQGVRQCRACEHARFGSFFTFSLKTIFAADPLSNAGVIFAEVRPFVRRLYWDKVSVLKYPNLIGWVSHSETRSVSLVICTDRLPGTSKLQAGACTTCTGYGTKSKI